MRCAANHGRSVLAASRHHHGLDSSQRQTEPFLGPNRDRLGGTVRLLVSADRSHTRAASHLCPWKGSAIHARRGWRGREASICAPFLMPSRQSFTRLRCLRRPRLALPKSNLAFHADFGPDLENGAIARCISQVGSRGRPKSHADTDLALRLARGGQVCHFLPPSSQSTLDTAAGLWRIT